MGVIFDIEHIKYVVRPSGFEPLTSASGGLRSIQLSYGRVTNTYFKLRPHELRLDLQNHVLFALFACLRNDATRRYAMRKPHIPPDN